MTSETKSTTLTGKPVCLESGWNGLMLDGQSLSTGQFSDPVLSTHQPYRNLTFGSGPRSSKPGSIGSNSSPGTTTSMPLVENYLAVDGATMAGETRCSGAANYAVEQAANQNGIPPAKFVIFASSAGAGGQPISYLSGAWYQLLLDQVAGANALAATAGVKYALHAIGWDENLADVSVSYTPAIVAGNPSSPTITVASTAGLLAGMVAFGYDVTTSGGAFLPSTGVTVGAVNHNNNQVTLASNPTATATGGKMGFGLDRSQYAAALGALAEKISKDAVAITGQPSPVHMLVMQDNLGLGLSPAINIAAPALGQWDLTRRNPHVHMVSPDYDCTRSPYDNQHLSNFAQLKMGKRLGRAYKQLVIDGKVPDAIDITSAVAKDTTLIATFRVPTPPLVLDNTNLPAVTNYGFVVRDSSGTLTINSVTVGGNNTSLVFTLNRAPNGDGSAMLRYALDHGGSITPPAVLGPDTAQWTISKVISGNGGVDRVYLDGTTPARMFTTGQSVTVTGVNGVNGPINGAHKLSAVDSGSGQWIELSGTTFSGGYRSGGTVTVPVTLDGAAAGNLRDSTTDTFVYDGTTYPLWHICPHFQMPITTTGAIA